MLRRDRLAARAKRIVGREMVVFAPARDIGPGDRSILTAADLERQGKTRIWEMARRSIWKMPTRMIRSKRGNRNHRQCDGDYTKRVGVSLEATRVSERFPCQPASSSDRVK